MADTQIIVQKSGGAFILILALLGFWFLDRFGRGFLHRDDTGGTGAPVQGSGAPPVSSCGCGGIYGSGVAA